MAPKIVLAAWEYTIPSERCVSTSAAYFVYSYIHYSYINSNWKTLHSIEWHCIAISNINILTSNLVFRLPLRTRENYFDLVLFPPDEIYDTYVEIDDNLQLNFSIYNALAAKANVWFILMTLILYNSYLFYGFIFPYVQPSWAYV